MPIIGSTIVVVGGVVLIASLNQYAHPWAYEVCTVVQGVCKYPQWISLVTAVGVFIGILERSSKS